MGVGGSAFDPTPIIVVVLIIGIVVGVIGWMAASWLLSHLHFAVSWR